ncbi:hypothetical protein Cni_G00771 [Canna indica]|uniref:Uncharacterized protein n=1 Tax=Canna indica TaxID=4628 RepID=A0AAQ3Q015_9LILI|nr:hypothetical protein Cni_G00771 [Canna indica]
MAITLSYSQIIIPTGRAEKSRRKASLCYNSKILPQASISLKNSDTNIKVFEDKDLGVICFRNENGEIVCEGFDEGPRFDRQTVTRRKFGRRELQIPNFLQIMIVQAIEDDEF